MKTRVMYFLEFHTKTKIPNILCIAEYLFKGRIVNEKNTYHTFIFRNAHKKLHIKCHIRELQSEYRPIFFPSRNQQMGLFRVFNLLKPTGHVMHQQFNIQQLYALPTLYLCVLYLSENKQRLVPLTA